KSNRNKRKNRILRGGLYNEAHRLFTSLFVPDCRSVIPDSPASLAVCLLVEEQPGNFRRIAVFFADGIPLGKLPESLGRRHQYVFLQQCVDYCGGYYPDGVVCQHGHIRNYAHEMEIERI